MATYADMVTLLLVFFVLLFTFSSIDVEKFRDIMASFSGALGVLEMGTSLTQDRFMTGGDSTSSAVVSSRLSELSETLEVLERLREFQMEYGLEDAFALEATERGVVIHFREAVLFDTGSAVIKQESRELLRLIAMELSHLPNFFRVEGHTDNVPIHNDRYPSNWELSTARAVSVVRFMIDIGRIPPERFSAVGYGEYRPIASNDDPAGRARNRRVDLVILDSQLGMSEPAATLTQREDVPGGDFDATRS